MPFFDNDGHRLYYEDTGGDGPAIVFSHGGFFDHTMWEAVVPLLSATHRCITWDSRGHGMSECHGPFTYWHAAEDIVALLDAAGVDDAVLVGMSQGGWATQRAALKAPERIRGVVLTGTSVRLLSEPELEGYGQLAQGWAAMGPVGDIAAAVLGVQFGGTSYDGSRYVSRWQSKPPAAWAGVWETILHGRDDIVDRLGEISCPALFVHGSVDQAFPVEVAEEMSQLVADSRGVIVVDGAPHCIALTHPDAMGSAIERFVAELG